MRWAVEAGQARQNLAQGLRSGRDIGVCRAAEVRGMAARHDPNLERRSGCIRGEGDVGVVLPDHARPDLRLLADESAVRALPFADHVACRPADLLGDAVVGLGARSGLAGDLDRLDDLAQLRSQIG